jgi:hypothetical protein
MPLEVEIPPPPHQDTDPSILLFLLFHPPYHPQHTHAQHTTFSYSNRGGTLGVNGREDGLEVTRVEIGSPRFVSCSWFTGLIGLDT